MNCLSRICEWILLGWCVLAVAGADAAAEELGVQQVSVVVKETAGIRRFGYPVTALLTVGEANRDVSRFRLLEKGRPIIAQFRRQDDASTVRLDFIVNHAPHETCEYVVEYGSAVESGPSLQTGVKVEPDAQQFRVLHASGLRFDVPRNLSGLLNQVRMDKTEYLRSGSAGLVIRYKDGTSHRAGGNGKNGKPAVAKIATAGPMASVLRFESQEAVGGGWSVASTVEMEFPISKSWVRVAWTVDDPRGDVAGLGADLNLNLQGEPTLVDFGAGGFVYAALRKGQTALLRQEATVSESRPGWRVLVGALNAPTPFVEAPGRTTSKQPALQAEGWAHVMDRQRCTAVAVADFARAGEAAEIRADSTGRLQVWKEFAADRQPPPLGTKRLIVWLHFVGMPVHVGAATSPQAMLAPLEVKTRNKK